jgi:hypothetical protein
MNEPIAKTPPKTSLPFDTSEWGAVVDEVNARAKHHSLLAQRFSYGIAAAIVIGFGIFVLAGTIAAMDEVDFYNESRAISMRLSIAQSKLEKLGSQPAEKGASSAVDPLQVQAALSEVAAAANATSRLEAKFHPDAKDLEEMHRRHLISTVATRISAASLLAFLVAILANLYRHNIRLSAFYSSRLDALRLSKATGLAAFERLSKNLVPDGLDVGKGPDTPTKQAIEFVRAISKSASSEAKSAKKSS